MQDYLNGYNYEDIFTVSGEIGKMNLKYIFPDEQGITAIFTVNGTAGIQLVGFGQ